MSDEIKSAAEKAMQGEINYTMSDPRGEVQVSVGPGGDLISKVVPNFQPDYYYGQFRMGQGQTFLMDPNRPYMSHSWIYCCASTIAKNLCRLPAKLAQISTGGGDEKHIYKHDFLNLLRRPNEWQSGSTFWEAICLGLLLPTMRSSGGQIFIVPEDKNGKNVDLTKGVLPARMYPLDDTVITPDIKDGRLIRWKYQIPGTAEGSVRYYAPNELIRIYNYNPYDISKGLAPYVPVKAQAMQDSEADNFNYFFFKNFARPEGVLTGDFDITPTQRQDISRVWQELYGGSHKAGSIAVLGNGLKYQDLARSHADMQWALQKEVNRDQIIAAYGLNELAFGKLKSVPFANVVEGRKIIWYDVYLAWQQKIWEAFNNQMLCYIPPEGQLIGESDLSEVQALKADLGERVKIAAQMIQQCTIPPAEAIRIVGLDVDPSKYPWMKTQVKNPTGGSLGGEDKPVGEAAGRADHMKKAVEDIIQGIDKKIPVDEKHAARNAAISDEYIKAVLNPGERSMRSLFQRYFSKQRKTVLDNVDAWSKSHKAVNQLESKASKPSPGPSVFLFDLVKENDDLMEQYKPNVKEQMTRETTRLSQELPNGIVAWSVNDDAVNAFVALRREAVTHINTTTFNAASDVIMDTVEQAIDEGWTNAKLAETLKDVLYDTYEIRISNANTIARTEVGSISSMTRLEAFRAEGIEKWEWVSAQDDKVRDGHDIDGEVQAVGDQFSNGLVMPLDPDGEPSNTISCRCVCIYTDSEPE